MTPDAPDQMPTLVNLVELARYTVTAGERVLRGQRLGGLMRVTDHPAGVRGHSYLVERGMKCDAHSALSALIADYTGRAERLDEIPMAACLDARIDQVELARYRLTIGERILYGQRVDGVVRVTDRPARGEGRSYLVECALERDGERALRALLEDYIRQARRLDQIPMAATNLARLAHSSVPPVRGGIDHDRSSAPAPAERPDSDRSDCADDRGSLRFHARVDARPRNFRGARAHAAGR